MSDPFLERVPMLSVHPDAAARDDVVHLASHLMESRRLLCLVWNHMHGQNMDGTRRPWPGEEGCAANWNKLSDAIGEYLEPLSQGKHPQGEGAPIPNSCKRCGETLKADSAHGLCGLCADDALNGH